MLSLSRQRTFWFSSHVSLLCMVTKASWHSMNVAKFVFRYALGSLPKLKKNTTGQVLYTPNGFITWVETNMKIKRKTGLWGHELSTHFLGGGNYQFNSNLLQLWAGRGREGGLPARLESVIIHFIAIPKTQQNKSCVSHNLSHFLYGSWGSLVSAIHS